MRLTAIALAIGLLSPGTGLTQDGASRWWEPSTDEEAAGSHVLGLWSFDGDQDFTDRSSHGHSSTLKGAVWHADGRFAGGGCLESAAGYPVTDESHGLHIKRSPALSPSGAFSAEMWIRPKAAEAFPDEVAPMLLDMKYVPDNHTGFMFSMSRANKGGPRSLALEIGLGTRTQRWYSDPFPLEAERWYHVAFTYDGAGTAAFFLDGSKIGESTQAAAGSMAAAIRDLSIGDRIGSLYRGFPGFIDEVRLTSGVREFQPLGLKPELGHFTFQRMSEGARLRATLINQSGAAVKASTASIDLPGGVEQPLDLPDLDAGATHQLTIDVDTRLRSGSYAAKISIDLPGWGGGEKAYRSTTTIPFVIAPRRAAKMPVVMWGLGGTESVIRELPRLKEIGFTHCLGLRSDHGAVWEGGAEALPGSLEDVHAGREMLNIALQNDFKIVAPLSPARYLRTAGVGKPFLRIDRKGNHYGREDISGLFPQVQDFCYHTGLAMGRAYGGHPAFDAALLHTEVRGESQVSFHPEEVEAYRKATGAEIPAAVTIKNGVEYAKLADFPADRVIKDDDPILKYLTWFWQKGDGWNQLSTRLHQGLKEGLGKRGDEFWTFHDPAARVPSISGSGGEVDVLSHWTYSYPDPIRIGLCTDELFEMARAGGHDQRVMKMTQLIWYRSQTAPENAATVSGDPSPWVDQDPNAAYITIAPMHIREALWWKLSRPIQGIMYHGWQSLVGTDSPGAYRYTNPNTRHELTRLIHEVVEPLGPTLMKVPDPPADVAFLESFTSQMFARRGTYGWNRGWAGDLYHVLMYAQLQPRVLYEESLLKKGGLDGIKLLVMGDCDVLTRSVMEKIKAFQAAGGLVVGDGEVCPAITPDYTIERFKRSKKADEDRALLQSTAADLRSWLAVDHRYQRVLDSSNADVVTRRRSFGSTDYVFAVNDAREFGDYVGAYGLVMEQGLPSETTLSLAHAGGAVYDLNAGQRLSTINADNGSLDIPLQLGPCEGRVLMVTEKPIDGIRIDAPGHAAPGDSIAVKITVNAAGQPIDAVVPVRLRIADPEGVEGEFSGYHAAVGGQLEIPIDFATNDRPGIWEVVVEELASGLIARKYLRLGAPK